MSEKAQENALTRMQEVWEASRRGADDPGLRSRFETMPRLPVKIVCNRLDKAINHGNVLRIAEAFRVECVVFGRGRDQDLSGAMGSHVWQPWNWGDAASELRDLKNRGYRRYALHLSAQARSVFQVDWRFPAALALGEELTGFETEILAECDEHVAIPLYGLVTSLNVAVAAGICVALMAEAYRSEGGFEPARSISRRMLGLAE